jgi:UDP-N-acetylmuramoylalanine--D-glutamate ligase
VVALESFQAPVHLILGGMGKGQDFSALRGLAHATYLIGEASSQLSDEVGGLECGELAVATARARAAAVAGEVVLLSPACASFDQFADYEARGRAFKALVDSLGGSRDAGAGERQH